MIEGGTAKLGLAGDSSSENSVFFLKNDSIYARKLGDSVPSYQSRYNTVLGVNGPSFTSNADNNTAIGYQSANDRAQHNGSVFVGAGAGYNVVGRNSILVGKKPIIIGEDDTIYEYNNVLTLGNDTSIEDSDESVLLGNNVMNFDKTSTSFIQRKLSRNTIIGHGNMNHAHDSVLIGYKNINEGRRSTVIGKGVKNYGTDSLLINPKDENGNSINFENHEDSYINIFGILTGSNDQLNIGKNVNFKDTVTFKKPVTVEDQLEVHSDVFLHSNLSVKHSVYAEEIDVEKNIFVRGSNVLKVLNDVSNSNAEFNQAVTELNSRTSFMTFDIAQLNEKIENGEGGAAENFTILSNMIRVNSLQTSSNTSELDRVRTSQIELEEYMGDTIATQMDTQFNSIIQKAIDGTYIFNIIRDSTSSFPSFAANSNLAYYEDVKFYDGPQPELSPIDYVFGGADENWYRAISEVEMEPQSAHFRSLQLSNVIMDRSNYFRNHTYFQDRVVCSNNLAVNSNFFINGSIQSFSNQVQINDNLLVHEALHVSDFIQTNAIKADYNFNNYLKCFSNLSFSNDWMIYTSNNFNNSNLMDLVFKGTNEGSEGLETRFTDFIPGQLNFTGQHRCSFSNLINVEKLSGYIVSSTGKYSDLNDSESIHIDDAIPIVKLSERAYDKTVFGVISEDEDIAFPDSGNRRCFQIGTVQFKTANKKKSKKIIVNSVGEGCVWVCNQAGDIRNGDLIVTSDSPGLGMRQNDDLIHSYTVAKATCDAIFSPGITKKFIGCTYKF
tara:strand:+ start:924 stop:3257 length:2334 start_codon:yes stop_codon:yes gene_type:complete